MFGTRNNNNRAPGSIRFRHAAGLLATAALTLFNASALAVTWTGGDGAWSEPTNWDPVSIPGPADTVLIEAGNVTIDPAVSGAINVATMELRGDSSLTAQEGTDLSITGDLIMEVTAGLVLRSSQAETGRVVLLPGVALTNNPTSGRRLNPSLLTALEIDTTESDGLWLMSLAGTTPAADGAVGPGTYSRVEAASIALGGALEVQLLHGFTPVGGDQFRIFEASRSRTGAFDGLPNGAVAASFGTIDLVIQYDATGVTLVARESSTLPGPGGGSQSIPIPTLSSFGLALLILVMGITVAARYRAR